ncbi:hypothetical protein KJ765_05435 [Candidatus Micrarchaeota archaeon]|nr:hypothetical protein [Candidatus Micrarchaeota archaeon]
MVEANLVIWTGSGVLVASVLLFSYVLKKMSSHSDKKMRRAEKRMDDVGVFLSHVSQDLTHARRRHTQKVHAEHAHRRMLETASQLGVDEKEFAIAMNK